VQLVHKPPFDITISNQVTGPDRATLIEIINATLEVITGDTFADRLAAVDQQELWLSPSEGTMPPREVVNAFLGRRPSMGPLPTVADLSRGVFGPRTPVADLYGRPVSSAKITLTKWELRRWRSGTPEGRSCAVNSAAHEIAHTIWNSADGGEQMFVDGDRKIATRHNRPLVSYMVGTVAQCTMLEKQGALGGPFAACVEKWGTNGFNSYHC
jgi:hypothetical protein